MAPATPPIEISVTKMGLPVEKCHLITLPSDKLCPGSRGRQVVDEDL
jgi:hypothetical protein